MNTLPRLYVSADLIAGQVFELGDGQAHYLARVMRLGGGDKARVFNGRDGEWLVELAIEGRKVSADAVEQIRVQPLKRANAPKLLFAPLKKTRTDFAVEKATELGVSLIQPISTAYTQTHRVKTERLEALSIEAAEQTERMDLPKVARMCSLDQALANWDGGQLIYCDEAGDAKPMIEAVQAFDPEQAAGILIGPEGGFSSEERQILRGLDFVVPVTLGPRILRAETAIVVALTLLQAVHGDHYEPPSRGTAS